MGHDCFEALTGQEIQNIYEQHQAELIEKAKRGFVELMLEHADIFSQVHSASPMATITQQQVREMVEILQEDSRYKALDRLDQERRLMLLQHLGFVHCPLREHCPSSPNCMDSVVSFLLDFHSAFISLDPLSWGFSVHEIPLPSSEWNKISLDSKWGNGGGGADWVRRLLGRIGYLHTKVYGLV